MKLIPIREHLEENAALSDRPEYQETLRMCIDFYKRVGYQPPWICYYVEEDDIIIGSAGFKGKPVNGRVEIAYGTQPEFQNQGIATRICKLLVHLALATDPQVIVTARTLMEPNYSTRVLKKNGFEFAGTVVDPEDGEVWEWVYKSA